MKIDAKNTLVKESNEIAKAVMYPRVETVWEERIIASVVAQLRCSHDHFPEIVIPASTLTNGEYVREQQLKDIKRSIKRLITIAFKIPMKDDFTSFITMFSKINIDKKGNITAKINSELAPHYLQLSGEFALRSLPEFNSLSGVYSQLLFKYLNTWKNNNNKIKIIDIDDLHEYLNTPKSFRKDFKSLRIRVLEPTHAEITQKTSLYYKWDAIRYGARKVIAIKFTFGEIIDVKSVKKPVVDQITDLQKESNQCWEKHHLGGGECKPDKRKKRCKYCFERGRMAVKMQKEKETSSA